MNRVGFSGARPAGLARKRAHVCVVDGVHATWQAAAGAALENPVSADEAAQADVVPEIGDPEGDWLCAWCHGRVANERDRFPINGTDQFTFSNPEGMRFRIITFLQTLGCRQTGVPTLEHTWFAGHAWSYCQCAECGLHLGWFYAGPADFVGLITDRIVRALYLRN